MHVKVIGEYNRVSTDEWIPLEVVAHPQHVHIEKIGFSVKGYWAYIAKPCGKPVSMRLSEKQYNRLSKALRNAFDEVEGSRPPETAELEERQTVQNPLDGMELGTD